MRVQGARLLAGERKCRSTLQRCCCSQHCSLSREENRITDFCSRAMTGQVEESEPRDWIRPPIQRPGRGARISGTLALVVAWGFSVVQLYAVLLHE